MAPEYIIGRSVVMTKEQIAHDLSVAKLYGSNLSTKELINQYHQYYKEFLSELNSEPEMPRTGTATQYEVLFNCHIGI